MQKLNNLVIIGTSHIAIESVKEVRSQILKYRPKVIALELDKSRLYALLNPGKKKLRLSDINKMGLKGFLFNLFGAWAEKRLGKMVATPPGSEMKAAVEAAGETNALIALIDQDITITLKRLSKSITLREKLRVLKEVVKGVILRKSDIAIDLTKVPEEKIIHSLTQRVKKEYPSIYKVLIEERNLVMAKALYKIMNQYKEDTILAIVGAGHEKELSKLIKSMG